LLTGIIRRYCIVPPAGLTRTRVIRPSEVARRSDAVFVVSNDAVRDTVARACGSPGVPWYGPTFDS
jgi:hypothetical protein